VLRVVADTNVYVSALVFAGAPDEVLALARSGEIELFVSPPILQELRSVLPRKFGWSAADAKRAVANVQGFATLVHPAEHLDVITEDEPDNRVLECAVAAGATVIVSGDGDLRRLKEIRGIRIVSPREFLDGELWLQVQ